MIKPVGGVPPAAVHQISHPHHPEPKPEPHAQTPPVQKSGAVSQDQVTLKSAGQPDHDSSRD